MDESITIRNYSKIIFFYPMMIYLLVAFIIEKVHEVQQPLELPYSQLGWLFVILLFMNLYVTTFDLSLRSFIIVVVLGVMTFVILLLTNVMTIEPIEEVNFVFDMGLPSNFYLILFVLIAILVLFGIVQSRFNYIRIEKQEIQIHGFLESGVKQYNSADMSYDIEFGDIFEFLTARAGSITFRFKDGKIVTLDTVVNLKNVKKKLDEIRNSISVKVQQP